jgi:Cu/Ag efflux protein CusF
LYSDASQGTKRQVRTSQNTKKEEIVVKRTFGAVIVSGLFAALTGSAVAADTALPKPIVVKDKVTIKATIEAIDSTNRLVTLKGSKGDTVTLPVDEDVVRFDQMKVGDTVTATYEESVAYEIEAPGATTPTGEAVAAAPLAGSNPGVAGMSMTVATVTIEAIDPVTPAVTVKTADGDVMSFRVRHKKNLKNVKVGDKVVITHTKALMVAVEAPK